MVKNTKSLRSEQWHRFSGPIWFPTIQYAAHPDPWVLVLQRRAGSLQAVIDKVRRRNLAISAVVLLLLAINMGVVMIAGFRAHNFAKLQMDFVASVSHELRTPLTTIFSAAENIKDGVVRGKANLIDYASWVMSQSRQLMDHVDRILLFASIRSGKQRYDLHAISVADIIHRVKGSVADLISDNERILEVDMQPGLPCVLGDAYAVCGCLHNLISNAIKYSGDDRRIRVSARLHQTENDAKEVQISVQDHGTGIDSSELQHIFEPFYRSPRVTAAQIRGTGLGLFLARHLAEAMQGRISVASQVGVGSIFTLHLQLAETEQKGSQDLSQKAEVTRI
jgi:signal transduction histidine kinase